MDIQSGYYEAGIVLFWLLFAYLFMDKFLFRGGLGEICFGKMRRRMAKALRGIAGWFDPVKEEQKKRCRRTKGKTEKKEVPVVSESEKRNIPVVKTEMKDKERAEAKKKAEDKNTVKLPPKELETNNLVVTRSYGTRQQPPINATGSGLLQVRKMPLLLLTETRKQRHQRQHKFRRNAFRNCSGTSAWKSGGLLRMRVPASGMAIADRLKTVTKWIPTS